MKITFFTENHYKGGLDTFLISLVNNWPHAEDIITIICNHDHPGIGTYRQRIRRNVFIHTHHIPNHTGLHRSVKRTGALGFLVKSAIFVCQYPLFAFSIYPLRKVLFNTNADRLVIVNGGYPGGSLCRAAAICWGYFRKRGSIHNFHNFVVPSRKCGDIIDYFIDHLVCKYTSAFVTVSEACARSMKARSILKKSSAGVILNGIDATNHTCFSVNKESSLREELNIAGDSKICLMLGTYEARKGHNFLLKAFRRVVDDLPSAHLVICGYGSANEVERVRVVKDGLDLKKNVHLFGFREDVPWLLEQTDVLAVPSQEYESFGLMIVEAMASKVPVVATRVGGIPEVLRDGEGGYCVDSRDVEGFAKYLLLLMRDEGLREAQGTIGFNRYRTLFTARRMAQEYASLIRS